MLDQESKVKLECRHSLSNNDILLKRRAKPGDEILVECPEACLNEDVAIYGEHTYSEDSSICLAAFHSGAMPIDGGDVIMLVT